MIYVFPDIHGRLDKLEAALKAVGFAHKNGAWRHPDATALFLGDFIDRGPENGRVINTVRAMQDAGQASAIMGNHELNALLYHTVVDGDGLRTHSPQNTHQHASFLAEFPLGAAHTKPVLEWIRTLPLAYETDTTRAVHACWDTSALRTLARHRPDLTLKEDDFHTVAQTHTPLGRAVEILLKGPECDLPAGVVMHDKEGTPRHTIRLKWWETCTTWQQAALSVDDPSQLPTSPFPPYKAFYPSHQPPVFFGHYWMKGTPTLQASNLLCLDYSAGLEGPMSVYHHTGEPLNLDRLIQVMP